MKKLFLLLCMCILSISCDVDNSDLINETASEEAASQTLSRDPGDIDYIEVPIGPEDGGTPIGGGGGGGGGCSGTNFAVAGNCTDGGFNGWGYWGGYCIKANVSGTYANGRITNLTFTLSGNNFPAIVNRTISYSQNKIHIYFNFTYKESIMVDTDNGPTFQYITLVGHRTIVIDPCLKTISF